MGLTAQSRRISTICQVIRALRFSVVGIQRPQKLAVDAAFENPGLGRLNLAALRVAVYSIDRETSLLRSLSI